LRGFCVFVLLLCARALGGGGGVAPPAAVSRVPGFVFVLGFVRGRAVGWCLGGVVLSGRAALGLICVWRGARRCRARDLWRLGF